MLVLMVGKLAERGGGRGLYVCGHPAAARFKMDELSGKLEQHGIPYERSMIDMQIRIECLGVIISFMPIASLEHRAQGLELHELVDDVTCTRRLTEREWYTMNMVRARIRS
jgi:hypothetical protein